ncbi:MAG: hypothetical protein J0I41_11140 [Filimonas sp.]|nr:hypothetical protein [Filimonas sp.]
MLKHILLCCALFVFTTIVSAQNKHNNTATTQVIPFDLTEANNMVVKAIINQADTVRLMFHTASSEVTLIEEATQKMKSLQFERTDSVSSWGGAGNTSRHSKSNTVSIGTLTWNNIAIWENKNSGPHTDGKFGTDLFANKVVEIDFDKKQIILHTTLPAKAKHFTQLKLSRQSDLLFLQATCKTDSNAYENKFLIHSGYSGTLLLDDQFVANNKIDGQLKTIDEKSLKDSYGNVLKVKKAILPTFMIGNEKLVNVPAGFFQGAIGRQKMSIIGGDVLKRFNIIIDAQRDYIYLKANKLHSTPYSNA